MSRQLALFCLSLAITQASVPVRGQAPGNPGRTPQSQTIPATDATSPAQRTQRPASSFSQQPRPFPRTGESQVPAANSAQSEPTPAPAPPQIIVNPPAPAPTPWTWHDRAAWGANIALILLGYVGILLALRTLKNME